MARRKNLKTKKEKSAGAIIFRKGGGKIYYLLLNYGKGYWGFSKGHVEKDESEKKAAKREIKEETGIKNIIFVEGFLEKISYYFINRKNNEVIKVLKEVIFYLVETKTKKIKISSEHFGFQWLEYKQAIKKTTFKNARNILKRANNYLKLKPNKKNRKNFFENKVYEIVKIIPKGKVLTYKEIARLAGSPKAFRAVGNILSKNKNPKIPCHRVIRSDGKLGGYNRGIKLKKKILQKEEEF